MARTNKEAVGTAPAADAQSQPGSDEGAQAGATSGEGFQPEPVGPSVAVRSVSAKGRWRIGRFFTPEPQLIALADLADEEKERLAADPELICQLVNAD